MKEKPVVGQRIICVPNFGRKEDIIPAEAIVTMVGRGYFYLDCKYLSKRDRFKMNWCHDGGNYTPRFTLFESLNHYYDSIEKEELANYFHRDAVWRRLSLDALRDIKKIESEGILC